MLALAGEGVRSEVIQRLSYEPGGAQDSGDMEPSAKTITATSKQGTPDYSTNLTVPAPGDSRIVLTRLGLRLRVIIDSITAGQLNYSVEVNGAQMLAGAWTGAGDKYAVIDLTTGQFNLGSANTLQVFLWVDAGNAVISLCNVWLAPGSTSTDWGGQECLTVAHKGLMSAGIRLVGVAGTAQQTLSDGGLGFSNLITYPGGNVGFGDTSCIVQQGIHLRLSATGTSPLAVLYGCTFVLRSLS